MPNISFFSRVKRNSSYGSGYYFRKLTHSLPLWLLISATDNLAKVQASICFISGPAPDSRYRGNQIATRAGISTSALYNHISTQCSVAIDEMVKNCPKNSQDMDFGSGYFGGTACTYSTNGLSLWAPHSVNPWWDPCITKVMEKECTNGFGTWQDGLAVVGFSLLGLAAGATLVMFMICCYQRMQKNNIDSSALLGQPKSRSCFANLFSCRKSNSATSDQESTATYTACC